MSVLSSLLWVQLAQAGDINNVRFQQRLGEPLMARFTLRDTTKMPCGEEELDIDFTDIDPLTGASKPLRFSTVDVPVWPTFSRLRAAGWSHREVWSTRSHPITQALLSAKEKGATDTVAITLYDCDGLVIDTVKVPADQMGLKDGDPIYGFGSADDERALRVDAFVDDDGFTTLSVEVAGAGVSRAVTLYGEWSVEISFDTTKTVFVGPNTVTPAEIESAGLFGEDSTYQFNTTTSNSSTHTHWRTFDSARHDFQGEGVFYLRFNPDTGTARGTLRADAAYSDEITSGVVTMTTKDASTETRFSTKSGGSVHTTRSATYLMSTHCRTGGDRKCAPYTYAFWVRPSSLIPADTAPSGYYTGSVREETSGEFAGRMTVTPAADGGYTLTVTATGEETKSGVFVTNTGGTESRALTFDVDPDGAYTYTEEIAGKVAAEGVGELTGLGWIDLDGFNWGTASESPPDGDTAIVESILNALLGAEDTDTGGMSWGMRISSTSDDGTTTGVSSVAVELKAADEDSPLLPNNVSGVLTSQNLNIERTGAFDLKLPADLDDVSVELYTAGAKTPTWSCQLVDRGEQTVTCNCSHL